ncbi:MAG TPA: hypothetical protein VJ966_00675 [Actinomycetes bacterium]|nr:hypothetical protein [Actinomycetes bacterium]
MAADRARIGPSPEASAARRRAEAALERAEDTKQRAVDRLPEVAEIAARLAGHRRADQFVALFREALKRIP